MELNDYNYQVIDGTRFTARIGPVSISLNPGKIFTVTKVKDTSIGYLIHWKAKININRTTLIVNGQTYVTNEEEFKTIAS